MNAKDLQLLLEQGVTEFAVYPQSQPGGWAPRIDSRFDRHKLVRATLVEDGVEWTRRVRGGDVWSPHFTEETLKSGVRVRLEDGEERVIERRAILYTWEGQKYWLQADQQREADRDDQINRAQRAAATLNAVAVGAEVRLTVERAESLVAAWPEIRRLREALAFYADKDNYDDDGTPGEWITIPSNPANGGEETDFEPDLGKRARNALLPK